VKWLKIVAKPELINNGDVTFYGVITHIAAADTQDEKLKIANKRNQFALEASSLGVWDWDVVNNKVFYSSESMRILEIESVDLFDKSERWDDIVHPDDLEAYYENIKEHFAGNTAYYENYHRVLTTQGKYKWILDRGKVIEWDSEGKPLRIIGTHTDISDQKEKELELVKTTNLFSEQNKRLVNFSHIVSHNLYSHASNIKMLLDFVEAEKDQTEKDSVLAHLRTVSNDLNETISNLSEIIDIQNNINITKEAIRVNSFLNRILATLSMTKSQNNVSIVNKIPEDAFVLFNPAYLESVLLNFTTNAIKYAHPERNLEIEYDFYSQQNKKVLTITDNGLGIDLVRHGESLFGLYKTFHRHRDSRGIGLYITKNQIEAMNGTVEVESTVGLGTTFKVIFAEERIL
jgi:K+-sensing histidine kinase KdpD